MLNNENHNSSCGRGIEMAAYLYDELKGPEKLDFESHLSNCAVCTDEFAAISETRFSVYEWRREEFDNLLTPEISISYERKAKQASSASPGAFAKLLEILAGMPAFAKAGLSFAAVALIAGSIFFFSNLKTGDIEISQNRNTKTINEASKPENPKNSDETVLSNKQITAEKVTVDGSRPFEKSGSSAKTRASDKLDAASKTSPKTPVQTAVKPLDLPKKTIEARDTRALQNAPRLTTGDETEDDSLRLADLFEEIGAS